MPPPPVEPPPPPPPPLEVPQPVGVHDRDVAGWTPHTSEVEGVEASEPVQAVVPLCALVAHEHAPHTTSLHAYVTERGKKETRENRTA